jgi:hypothetical protein
MKKASKAIFHPFLEFSEKIGSIHFLEQARWVKMVKVSQRIAKSLWDQTFGSERAALAMRKSGSLSTGSPVSSLELMFLKGLMYSQATVTTCH